MSDAFEPPATDEELRTLGFDVRAGALFLPPPLQGSNGDGIYLMPAASVKIRRARYAWNPRIPLGGLTLMAGEPGKGKSTVTSDISARATRGLLEGDLHGEATNVVMATAEDALAFVMVPRLLAAGADLQRVHFVTVHRDGTDLGLAIPDDLVDLRGALRSTGARLLVVDPLLAHIPVRIDGYKDQHVRVALAPLHRLAEELDIAVLGIMHLNKREAGDLFSRIGGSGGFLAAARSALLVAADPNDDHVRVVAHGKSNLAPAAGALRFRLQPEQIDNPDPDDDQPINVPRVEWLGESDLEVRDLLRTDHRSEARTEASSWLLQVLKNGPMPATWVKSAAEEAGHSWRTVERARQALGIRSDRVGGMGKDGRWEWSLP